MASKEMVSEQRERITIIIFLASKTAGLPSDWGLGQRPDSNRKLLYFPFEPDI
jgi:hypothetical protein